MNKRVIAASLPFVAAIAFATAFEQVANAQTGTWERGKVVGLRQGTCIREGPGFQYRAHTRVPENEWAVQVIDGPRVADGRKWWDTSRRAAGDPSGGTGWVTEDQSDTNCAFQSLSPAAAPISEPASSPPPSVSLPLDALGQIQHWFTAQPLAVQVGAIVLALVIAGALWRLIGGIVMELISALVLSLVIYLVMSLTRGFWQDIWYGLTNPILGQHQVNLAIVLAALPIVSFLISLIHRSFLKHKP
jgi:hypothetical protein